MSYPEHEKLHETMELSEFSNRLGAYLDDERTRFVLAEWGPAACRRCGGSGQVYNMRANEHSECGRCEGSGWDPELKDLSMARGGLNQNLAEIFDVDYNKLMDEKDQMLTEIRANA